MSEVSLTVMTRLLQVRYTNYRGETSERVIEPTSLWYGSTEWHPEPQWMLTALDTERDVIRDFALRGMEVLNDVSVA